MTRQIDYLFTLLSPWAYLGSDAFHAIAQKHGANIRYRPVMLGEVFSETGGLPLAKRHPARQSYRWMEMQRWREARQLPLTLKPKFWPFDAALADRLVLAITETGGSPAAYLAAAHRAIWAEERNLADEAELARLMRDTGSDPALIERAKSEEIGARYAANRDWALNVGVFGAPSYVLNGEIFWGQDRLIFLDEALASKRLPYQPV
jgi:2-hydroxychromene-2-carboxylate isomerase